jgi:hypothetical protein
MYIKIHFILEKSTKKTGLNFWEKKVYGNNIDVNYYKVYFYYFRFLLSITTLYIYIFFDLISNKKSVMFDESY